MRRRIGSTSGGTRFPWPVHASDPSGSPPSFDGPAGARSSCRSITVYRILRLHRLNTRAKRLSPWRAMLHLGRTEPRPEPEVRHPDVAESGPLLQSDWFRISIGSAARRASSGNTRPSTRQRLAWAEVHVHRTTSLCAQYFSARSTHGSRSETLRLEARGRHERQWRRISIPAVSGHRRGVQCRTRRHPQR